MGDHYRAGSEFTVSEYTDITHRFNVHLIKKDREESYIVGPGVEGSIEIDSGSACFTLPEGVYPGENF